jgi:hypothetical protein
VSPEHAAALGRAKARLDRLDLYPTPVRIDRVRVVVAPWFFRLPFLRRFDGYCLIRTILLRRADSSDDLVAHELCHVWQMQHRPLRLPLSYLRHGYASNPYEAEARRAVAATRAGAVPGTAPVEGRSVASGPGSVPGTE